MVGKDEFLVEYCKHLEVSDGDDDDDDDEDEEEE